MIRLLIAFFCCVVTTNALAQEVIVERDTLAPVLQPIDTMLIESYAKRFDPRKALFYSAILPGAGQVYNRKYWKVPLVYGGLITGAYLIDFYNSRFLQFRNELFTLLNDGSSSTTPTTPSGLNENQLRRLTDRARRERDFWSIMTGLWYLLQIVDAHVDAHLKEFDVNPQLKARVEPFSQNDLLVGRSTGVSLIIRF